ncbi:MAG TPA: hypothetical protein VK509_10665 [Polyangiales bacterium]|nr:hypothetical protein [Polyangiales bacterium]
MQEGPAEISVQSGAVETGSPEILALPELQRDESEHGYRLILRRSPLGAPVAEALLLPAARASLLRGAGFAEASLEHAALLANVRVHDGADDTLGALLYCAGRRARIAGANMLLAAVGEQPGAASQLLGLSRVPRSAPPGYVFAAQRLDIAMHRAYRAMVEASHAPDPQLLADEVGETIRSWVAGAPQWPFFVLLHERRLAREQYVYLLSNLYQFVRHTTRLIGRAISHSVDPVLRKHWISHLNGEINHEVIIERDLAHMGEDVEFVMRHMPPSSRTQEFMAIQESMIAYYEDPVLFMASPLAAEAITAFLDQRFIDDLHACAQRWGVAEPRSAMKFLTSHMSTDGGEDGHWKMSLDALPRLIRDESTLAMFLTTNASSRRAMEGVWSSTVGDTAVFSDA